MPASLQGKVASFKRTAAQKNADRARIAKLHLSGWSSYEIADELARLNPYSLNPTTIQKDIKAIEELWRESQIAAIDRQKAVQIERDELEAEAAKVSRERDSQFFVCEAR